MTTSQPAGPAEPVLVLVCAATARELTVTSGLREAAKTWQVVPVVTGVGIPHTLLHLPALIARHRPALIVNTGIAGAYEGGGWEIGDLVLGTSEVFADLGMEVPGGEGFEPLGAYDFADASVRAPLPLSAPETAVEGLKRGRGATVNQCTGTDETGARRRRLFNVDFESMEGAAAALAARAAGLPLLEIRAISNMAARRDMRPENVARALERLTDFWARDGRAVVDAALRAARGADRTFTP